MPRHKVLPPTLRQVWTRRARRNHNMPPTPPPHTTSVPVTIDHPPPSVPSSPLAKRPRINPMAPNDSSAPSSTSNPVISPVTAEPALRVKFLSDKAKAPTRGSAFAAGYDLYAAEACSIPAKGKALVGTKLAISVPGGCCGFLLAHLSSG